MFKRHTSSFFPNTIVLKYVNNSAEEMFPTVSVKTVSETWVVG